LNQFVLKTINQIQNNEKYYKFVTTGWM